MDVQTLQILLAVLSAFGVIYITIPVLIKVAYLKELYDKPDSDRKIHDRFIPTFGGVAIFMAFITGFSISGVADQLPGYPYLVAALTILFFAGLKDDVIGLSPVKKILMQLVSISLIIFGANLHIDNFYGVFGVHEIPYVVSVTLTAFTMIVIINAYNLIDGLDGLAGGIGGIASLFFGIGFWVAGEPAMAVLSLILMACLLGFLRYNFRPASIFMGDTGSLIVGFLLSIQAIHFVKLNEAASFTDVFGTVSPILPVAILAIPLYDTLSVFYKRARKGRSPFAPDRTHIHHIILNMGFSHKGAAILLYICSALITLMALGLSFMNVNVLLATTLLSTILLLPSNGFKRAILKKAGLDIELHLRARRIVQDLKGDKDPRVPIYPMPQVNSSENAILEN